MTERWRAMEQLEAIWSREPVYAGDLISKKMTLALVKGGLVMRDEEANFVLTPNGRMLMKLWKPVSEEV